MENRGSEKIIDWLEIDLAKLSSQERTALVVEIMETFNALELRFVRDTAEKQRVGKLKETRNELINEFKLKLLQADLTLEEVLEMEKKTRRGSSPKAKYRSPDGLQTWSGRGRASKWLLDLEAAGHHRDEFLIKDE